MLKKILILIAGSMIGGMERNKNLKKITQIVKSCFDFKLK